METYKAELIREEENTTLSLVFSEDQRLNIILTDDNPNHVKGVFNSLLKRLKKGTFKFELEEEKEDLYYHVSKEYISQLNNELLSVYKELEDFELIEEIPEDEEE
ncbi:hypothetical protein GUB10_15795 [Salegentibacter sp. BLCTC]|uniref:hypothetical protein n=1 Tax=Salegentibacter sp. BLCTC TaxID=2697368 RepID=UPI00187B9D6E|nr:hypothetical protein [Salegentibacter sp. BLCTC]MBE7641793.1 hypothetical protein [Salegentibacter sp. BLCTC]